MTREKVISMERATVNKTWNRLEERSKKWGRTTSFDLTGSHLTSRPLISSGRSIRTSVPASLQSRPFSARLRTSSSTPVSAGLHPI